MTLMPSRLLTRLDADIAAERDPLRADCLRAERAAYLVRQGHTEEVKAELDALHLRHDRRPNAEMSAWLSLVESLVSFFSDMGPLATDKMRRAHALSQAAGLTQLQARCAAWLALMTYLRLDISTMARYLSQSLALALPENHAARSRASLVIALAYHTAERLDLALPWYTRSREHAVSEGDETTISAVMHNMAWIRSNNMRKAALTGERDRGEGEHALMAAESTWNFDQLVGATSLDTYVPLLHAQILSLQGQPAQALELYKKHLQRGLTQGLDRVQGSLIADMAWCRVQVGELELAREDAIAAEACLEPEGNFDDRAPGYSRLAQVFASLGDADAAKRNETSAALMWQGHAKIQSSILGALGAVPEIQESF